MCTVSIVALPADSAAADFLPYRMACNRDESPARPPAEPPTIERFGRRQAILPRDPSGGGTWIAANDAGLTLTLLNHNLPPDRAPAPQPGWHSRGAIIPLLLGCDSAAAALAALDLFQPGDTAPFRLVMLDGRQRGLAVSDGRTLHRTCTQSSEPIVFASSGLGDERVAEPRETLFARQVAGLDPAAHPAAQDAFHRHSWPDARHLSVCMWRPDARTVSCTIVAVTGERVTLRYLPVPPDQPGDWHEVSLARNAGR